MTYFKKDSHYTIRGEAKRIRAVKWSQAVSAFALLAGTGECYLHMLNNIILKLPGTLQFSGI